MPKLPPRPPPGPLPLDVVTLRRVLARVDALLAEGADLRRLRDELQQAIDGTLARQRPKPPLRGPESGG